MSDIHIIKSLLDKQIYNKYVNILTNITNLEHELHVILNTLKEYFNTYSNKDSITLDELYIYLKHINPSIKLDLYDSIFQQLQEAEIYNDDLLIQHLNRLSETATANLIMQEAVEIVNSKSSDGLQRIGSYIEDHQKLTELSSEDKTDVNKMSLAELIRINSAENGLAWPLSYLNSTVGPLRPGTLSHIFAYTNNGKTSLAISTMVHYAKNCLADSDCVLFLSNEEACSRTKIRSYCALLKSNEVSIVRRQERANTRWNDEISDRIVFKGEILHMHQVENYIAEYRPKVVIVDQGPKVAIPGNDNEVKTLQRIYNQYRQIAVKNDLILITLGQSDVTCENKKVLKLSNMDMSKVGIPGELDVAIGIGKTAEEGFEDVRYLSVCKNKLTGRHGYGAVNFDFETCTYKDREREA